MGLMNIDCRQCPFFDVDEGGQAMCVCMNKLPDYCPLLKDIGVERE
jgi:hypothetical protein